MTQMQIVIPMAGQGYRFKQAGYSTIKPLIEIDGSPMITHVIKMFSPDESFIFICSNNHLENTDLKDIILASVPDCRIVGISPHKNGPVFSVMKVKKFISDTIPVIVNYCDFFTDWDFSHFKQTVINNDFSGSITAYKGFHPHSLGNTLYAYIKENNGLLKEISEKRAYTDNRMEEFASAGTYYFKSGKIMKNSFERLIDSNSRVNGEFYASTPFNYLVNDGLKVSIYPLNHFLQWGTPEDLEEYQVWSDFFNSWYDWKPTLPPIKQTNLFPMAGLGLRFQEGGFTTPKPFITVGDKPIAQHTVKCIPKAINNVTVLNKSNRNYLNSITFNGNHHPIFIDSPTSGQASSCFLARNDVAPGLPLLIAPCDAISIYDENRLISRFDDHTTDCLVFTFKNHPHANRNPNQFSWVVCDDDLKISKISCKRPVSSSIKNDHGIIGIFWFRSAKLFFDAAKILFKNNIRINNEFYVDSIIDVLLDKGFNCYAFEVLKYIGLGTPDEVRTFNYWETYFHNSLNNRYTRSIAGE